MRLVIEVGEVDARGHYYATIYAVDSFGKPQGQERAFLGSSQKSQNVSKAVYNALRNISQDRMVKLWDEADTLRARRSP